VEAPSVFGMIRFEVGSGRGRCIRTESLTPDQKRYRPIRAAAQDRLITSAQESRTEIGPFDPDRASVNPNSLSCSTLVQLNELVRSVRFIGFGFEPLLILKEKEQRRAVREASALSDFQSPTSYSGSFISAPLTTVGVGFCKTLRGDSHTAAR